MQTLISDFNVKSCNLCPRKCGADRTLNAGLCGGRDSIRCARSALHHWEEPCISGTKGSGAVFFSGCTLSCAFCQNKTISHGNYGTELTEANLGKCILDLQKQGAHNINFVTGTHFAPWIISAVRKIKDSLHIPVIWNTSGYETIETLRALEEITDIYLPDFKYLFPETGKMYSKAENYTEYAEAALQEMYRQTGKPIFDENGIMQKGLIVRHLVLPGHRHESMALLKRLTEILPTDGFLISLMGQYTPPSDKLPFKNLNRRLTTMEYESVLSCACELGLEGFSQELTSAKSEYTPSFNLEGLYYDK